MKKLETKGRSRKQRHHLFHKEMKQMKRLLSVCLCTSMISTSIGSTTALAATAPLLEKNEAEEENQNFVLDQEELSVAATGTCLCQDQARPRRAESAEIRESPHRLSAGA